MSDNLIDDVEAFIRRFVAMHDDKLFVVALWVIHTHCFERWSQTPYLSVTSPEKQCGKSRLLEVLQLLCKDPWYTLLPSEAIVFRMIEAKHPSMLLDEVDAIFNPKTADRHEGLRGMLNAGNRRGARVARCFGPQQQLREFDVWCPKVLAGIGVLPDTITDRSIPIRLERRLPDQEVEDFELEDVEPGAIALRDQIVAWAASEPVLERKPPDMPKAISDRAREGCKPLVAIADALGCGDRARAALVGLLVGERTDADDTLRQTLLGDLRTIFDAHPGAPAATSDSLVKALKALEEAPWATYYGRGIDTRDLAKLLKPYGVKSKSVRKDGEVHKGYKRDDLHEAWARYLPAVTVVTQV